MGRHHTQEPELDFFSEQAVSVAPQILAWHDQGLELAILPDVPTAKEAGIGSHLDSEQFRSIPRTWRCFRGRLSVR